MLYIRDDEKEAPMTNDLTEREFVYIMKEIISSMHSNEMEKTDLLEILQTCREEIASSDDEEDTMFIQMVMEIIEHYGEVKFGKEWKNIIFNPFVKLSQIDEPRINRMNFIKKTFKM